MNKTDKIYIDAEKLEYMVHQFTKFINAASYLRQLLLDSIVTEDLKKSKKKV